MFGLISGGGAWGSPGGARERSERAGTDCGGVKCENMKKNIGCFDDLLFMIFKVYEKNVFFVVFLKSEV